MPVSNLDLNVDTPFSAILRPNNATNSIKLGSCVRLHSILVEL